MRLQMSFVRARSTVPPSLGPELDQAIRSSRVTPCSHGCRFALWGRRQDFFACPSSSPTCTKDLFLFLRFRLHLSLFTSNPFRPQWTLIARRLVAVRRGTEKGPIELPAADCHLANTESTLVPPTLFMCRPRGDPTPDFGGGLSEKERSPFSNYCTSPMPARPVRFPQSSSSTSATKPLPIQLASDDERGFHPIRNRRLNKYSFVFVSLAALRRRRKEGCPLAKRLEPLPLFPPEAERVRMSKSKEPSPSLGRHRSPPLHDVLYSFHSPPFTHAQKGYFRRGILLPGVV